MISLLILIYTRIASDYKKNAFIKTPLYRQRLYIQKKVQLTVGEKKPLRHSQNLSRFCQHKKEHY
jgi:hypothetical protein